MKKAVAIILSAISLVSIGAAYIPKASIRQISNSPLRHTELCWIENSDCAEVYIGSENGKALRASDPAALRGARIRKLLLGEFAVSASSGFTYDPAKNEYSITVSATNTIIITVPETYDVTDFGYHYEEFPPEGSIAPETPGWARLERNGNVAVITVIKGTAPLAKVSNISVYAKTLGDGEGFTDLTETTFRLRDSLGYIDFANVREWAMHLYDGNRGEHWANYPATNYVRLAKKPIVFDEERNYIASINQRTQLVFQAGGVDAMSISQGAAPTNNYTYFSITDIDVSDSDAVVLSYAHDIDSFNLECLGVAVCEDLNKNVWFPLTEEDFTATSSTVTIPFGKTGYSMRFFKLTYRGVMTEAVKIVLRGTVVVPDAFVIRGEDKKYYKIKVNGGAITAEEVSL